MYIPMSDGCRLAARIWIPEDAQQRPVPAVLEYIPYRKRDFMRLRDEPMHAYLAGHGYAAVRVDLRGSGDSEGILADEYLPQELADAGEVIDWLSRQSWCTGKVGMTGISWGGFNSLQVAAQAPAALRAIITLCSTDDRYADDAHYMGGCLLNENQIWGTVLFALNALPPDPAIVGDGWRERWLDRLEHDVPFPAVWLRHQHRDAYWAQGSVCEDIGAIRCAVYAIGGWADGYSNAVPRLLEHLECPKKGLIGPWAHAFPHDASPGPSIGYLQEALRWWDHWLKGVDTRVMAEPLLRAWIQDGSIPEPFASERPGRWVAESTWPSPNIEPCVLHLTRTGGLADRPDGEAMLSVCSPQTTGATGGDWCGFGAEGEAAMDQRPDDGRSLCFERVPFEEDLEFLGAPEVYLEVASDRPVAFVIARLTEVFPDGTSSLITYGVANLTHREGHADPTPLVEGRFYDVRIALNDVGHRVRRGNAVRLALSTCFWPLVWPAPRPVTLTVNVAKSRVVLPVRPTSPLDSSLVPFGAPEAAGRSTSHVPLAPRRFTRTITRDQLTNAVVHRLVSVGGDLDAGAKMRIEDIDLDLGHTVERQFTIDQVDPSSACAEVTERYSMRRGDWCVRIHAETRLTSDPDHFRLRARLEAREGNPPRLVFEREWDETIERQLV